MLDWWSVVWRSISSITWVLVFVCWWRGGGWGGGACVSEVGGCGWVEFGCGVVNCML